jgi:hypothetical protein
MDSGGYSGKALIKKPGIRPGMKILVLHAPENYFRLLHSDISGQFTSAGEIPDLIHLFAKNNALFEKEMKKIVRVYIKKKAVIIWVSWYKKSSGITTDLSEDLIRNFALHNNLVDIKVCAVSDEWSGLKLVVPLSKRPVII